MNVCPTCTRALTEEAEACPRCGCDVSTLRAGRRAARRWFDIGSQALREERFEAARTAFDRAWRWHRDSATAQGRAVAALGLGRYAEALRYSEQATNAEK